MTCRPPASATPGPELDVGAAAGHVGGDGDRAALAGAGDDFGFLLVVLGVEDGVDDALALEHAREVLADFDRDRADEDRPALGRGSSLISLSDRVVLLAPGLVDRVVGVLARAPACWSG